MSDIFELDFAERLTETEREKVKALVTENEELTQTIKNLRIENRVLKNLSKEDTDKLNALRKEIDTKDSIIDDLRKRLKGMLIGKPGIDKAETSENTEPPKMGIGFIDLGSDIEEYYPADLESVLRAVKRAGCNMMSFSFWGEDDTEE